MRKGVDFFSELGLGGWMRWLGVVPLSVSAWF